MARLRILRAMAHDAHVVPVNADTRRMRHALVDAGLARHVHLDDGVTEVGFELTDAGRARAADR